MDRIKWPSPQFIHKSQQLSRVRHAHFSTHLQKKVKCLTMVSTDSFFYCLFLLLSEFYKMGKLRIS